MSLAVAMREVSEARILVLVRCLPGEVPMVTGDAQRHP